MSSTSDTDAIDEKKEEETITDENLPSNIGKFLITLLIIVFILILNFSAGGFVLYGCKVGQANILPTDEKCMPYENNVPSVQPIQINIFETFTDPVLSKKISFPYAMNNKSTILDMLRDYKQKSDSN